MQNSGADKMNRTATGDRYIYSGYESDLGKGTNSSKSKPRWTTAHSSSLTKITSPWEVTRIVRLRPDDEDKLLCQEVGTKK